MRVAALIDKKEREKGHLEKCKGFIENEKKNAR
jgi:hypothetical protein